MSILIRKAELQDIEDVFEIQEKQGLSFWSIADYHSEIANSESIFLVAESDRKIVGFIFARLITAIKVCEILNFGVAEKYQNQGTGKLRTLNYEKLELEVREQNLKAIDFYLNNNFVKDGIRKNFYSNPVDNAVLMSFIF
jgi:[ribosomal protein S18]-alanine N-acetyltransferase